MSSSLIKMLIDKLNDNTKSGKLSWYKVDDQYSLYVAKQLNKYKTPFNIPKPPKAFCCDLSACKLMLLRYVKATNKKNNIIHISYDYKLLIQLDKKENFVDIYDFDDKLNTILDKFTELSFSEQTKEYPIGLPQKISKFIFSILSEKATATA